MPTSETKSVRTGKRLIPRVVCPPWCEGCGPNDPMHRSELVTIGREATGWVSLRLLLDRFARREPMLKLDATRFGATQTVLFTGDQLDRLIDGLSHAQVALVMTLDYVEQGRSAR